MKQTSTNNNGNQEVLDAIGELATAVGLGFDKVENRLERVDARLGMVEGRLDHVDKTLLGLQDQINRIETYVLQDHQRRLEAIEHKLGIER